ncbi:MAG TPA: glutamate 5-kinase [Anaerolineae bacterium]|nr:glutamate 5-kinase [Anaerolineae bacterium]
MADHKSERVVVKIGSNVLSSGSERLDRAHLIEIVRQIAQLHGQGYPIAIVTSGAVLAGRERMGYPQLRSSIPFRQMLAAVGQSRLMHLYEQFFDIYNIQVAQILLTADDFRDRQRYLNARDTMLGLLDERVVPIINENDTVATDEIKVGDNDNLAALVVTLIDAELLILLSDIAGLYDGDPHQDPNARLIREVRQVDASIWGIAGESTTDSGTGGMRTKIEAAQLVQRAGSTMVIAHGSERDVLLRIMEGEPIGTRFLPLGAGEGGGSAAPSGMESRKRWILAGSRALGRIHVDRGAAVAMTTRGKSLLPVGVTRVDESFERGETVRIFAGNHEIARGVVRYSAHELDQIKGLHSDEIRDRLGYDYGDEVIHHNDMVILDQAGE